MGNVGSAEGGIYLGGPKGGVGVIDSRSGSSSDHTSLHTLIPLNAPHRSPPCDSLLYE